MPISDDKWLREVEAQMEARAESDYAAHKGKVLLVRTVTGYKDHDDSVDVPCYPPARMRVCRTSKEDLHHWCDNWLDPYWDVELIEPHPALIGIRSMWVFGPSYCTDGRTDPSSAWAVEETTAIQALKDWWRK